MGLVEVLIKQSKLPSGWLGRVMLRIMNKAHYSLTHWGIEKLEPGVRVLDVGCGGGMALSLLVKSGKFEEVIGVDISTEAIEIATKKNREYIENGKVKVLKTSVLALPFPDNYFCAVTAFQTHYH